MNTIYTKHAADRKLVVTRTFDAATDLVWQAWTDSTLLDQWWAPKPWQTMTKYMDFSEGGYWLYSMNGPEGEQHWARADYEHIEPTVRYTANDAFCDAEGNITDEAPGMHWSVKFTPAGSATQVIVEVTFDSLEDMDKIVEMGFREGFAAAHDNLDVLLASLRAA